MTPWFLSHCRTARSTTRAWRTRRAEYALNCGAVNSLSIPAGHAIRFEMELNIPASTPVGPTSLVWRTTEPTGLSATAAINVLDA